MNTPTTELDAINTMLGAIGAPPVNRLSNVGQDVIVARQILAEVTREIQTEEFYFNTEEGLVFEPDENGYINLGPNITRVLHCTSDADPMYITKTGGAVVHRDLAVRGERLYDKTNHTYVFDGPITADVTMQLPFTELPLEARVYAIIRAARKFLVQTLGDQDIEQWTAQDEQRARLNMIAADTRQANATVGAFKFQDPLLAVKLSR